MVLGSGSSGGHVSCTYSRPCLHLDLLEMDSQQGVGDMTEDVPRKTPTLCLFKRIAYLVLIITKGREMSCLKYEVREHHTG